MFFCYLCLEEILNLYSITTGFTDLPFLFSVRKKYSPPANPPIDICFDPIIFKPSSRFQTTFPLPVNQLHIFNNR